MLHGQAYQKINFTSVNNIDGLPNNKINAIVKDKFGFIWIATNDGLCRYESSGNVKIYGGKDPAIPTGIQNSNIRSLCVDRHDNLWVGTILGGLSRYHIPSDTWTTFQHSPTDNNSISNDEVLSILEDQKGQIWVGTEFGLNLFHQESRTFTSFLPTDGEPNTLHARAVLSIMEDDKGFIWVGTWAGGFYLMLPSADGLIANTTFRKFQPSSEQRAQNIWTLHQDQEKRYWVGTHGAGLYLMDVPTKFNNDFTKQEWKPTFYQVNYEVNNKSSISSDRIKDIFHDKTGSLWVGTVGGLSVASRENLNTALAEKKENTTLKISFNQYTNQMNNPSSLIHNNINKIYKDDQGIIWFSTYSGISKYSWYTNQFGIHDFFSGNLPNIINTHNVYVGSEGTIWVGSKEKGLLQYDPKTKTIKEFKYNHLLLNSFVSTMHSPDKNTLYLGTKEGISVLNTETFKVINYPVPDKIKIQNPNLVFNKLFLDSKDRIWAGAESGLYILDKKSGEYYSFKHKTNDPKSISDNAINSIIEDKSGNIWIATYNGLNLIEKSENISDITFKTFKHDPKNPTNSLSSNRLICIKEINGILYFGTVSGLCSYDLKNGTFHDLSKGKSKYCFQSLEVTRQGNLWGSTTDGIVFYDVANNIFNKFEKADGIRDMTFRLGASSQDQAGNFYFGSYQGITYFHPDKIRKNEKVPPVHITGIKTMSPTGVSKTNTLFQDEIVLNHDDYYLSIDFAGLNHNRPEKNQYAYQLVGFDKDWVYNNDNQSAVYTNLEAGDYQFHVKAANNDGLWNQVGKTLHITIKPAFWETGWFIGGCIFILGGILFTIFQFYTRNIRFRNQQLQLFNENLNKQITERKKAEPALQEREQELVRSNKDLEQFAYIASHDLQEPLRTVSSFIGLLGRNHKDSLPKEALLYIDFATSGVERMSNLIKSLLTYSKVGRQGINISRVNFNEVLISKLMDLGKKIEERKVVIEMDDLPEIDCESNQLGMVFYNLINNAIKFNKSTTPVVKIKNHQDTEAGSWKFSIQDNGIGIKAKDQEKIFEIFGRLHSRDEYEGTGIGLALCQKIVHAHNGKIWLESIPGEGTTFFLTISKSLLSNREQERKSLTLDVV